MNPDPIPNADVSYKPEGADYLFTSRMEHDTFSFIWSLEKVSNVGRRDKIESPIFSGGPIAKHNWQLVVNPKFKEQLTFDEDGGPMFDYDHETGEPLLSEMIAVSLRLVSLHASSALPISKIKASFEVMILNPEYKPLVVKGGQDDFLEFDEMKESSPIPLCEPLNVLSPPEPGSNNCLVFNDTLTLHCRIWIDVDPQHCVHGGLQMPESTEVAELRRLRHLIHDLRGGMGLDNLAFTDMTLVTLDKPFRVHKFMLSSRSPVFRAMYESGMVESVSHMTNIEDFEAPVVEAMLKYLYFAKIDNDFEHMLRLIRIADKYELLGLKKDCVDIVAKNLKAETVIETLKEARHHNDPQLKNAVYWYITRNKKQVMENVAFMDYAKENPNVLVDLYSLS